MHSHTRLIALLVLSAPASLAQATTLRVPTDHPTIQAAIDAAADGDKVVINPGVYSEQIDFLGKAITVTSRDGPANTIIDGMGAVTVVIFFSGEGRSSVLSGLTIRNGLADIGAGVFIGSSSPTIRDNIFTGNHDHNDGWGVGIGGAGGGAPLIERNLFHSNVCGTTFLAGIVAIVNGSEPQIINNVFRDNGNCPAVNLTLEDGLLPQVSNNTFVGNKTGVYVDSRTGGSHHLVRNNIIVGNDVGIEVAFATGTLGLPRTLNNLVYGNDEDYRGLANQTGLDGNLSAPPLFRNEAQDDFHLTANSPAIDAGESSAMTPPRTDFDRSDRPIDGNGDGAAVIDIGAFEFDPAAPPPPPPPPPPDPQGSGGGGATGALALAALAAIAVARRRGCKPSA